MLIIFSVNLLFVFRYLYYANNSNKNNKMKKLMIIVLLMSSMAAYSQQTDVHSGIEQELLNISKNKWKLMAEQSVDSLDALFHEKAMFVHMGATMNKEQELNTIKSGGIKYKHAEIEKTSIRIVDQTAIILDKIRLTAIVGGREVVNPFMVTEVYVQTDSKWRLVSLSFTRLLGD